jgi:hypoxia up-regulated 1
VAGNETSANTTETVTEIEYETKMVRKVVKDLLNVNATLLLNSMTRENILASKKVLREYREIDRVKKDLAKSRNDLEAFIIDKSSALQDEDSKLYAYSSEEERQKASKNLLDAEDWIYGDEAETATAKVFKDKLKSIRSLVDAIEDRIFEASIRDQVIESSKSFVEETMKTVKTWSKSKPWITKEETEVIQGNITEFKIWIDEQIVAQKAKQFHEDPAFKVYDVKEKLDNVRKAFTRLNIKSKPIEKPPKKNDTKKSEKDTPKEDVEDKPSEDGSSKKGEEPSGDHSEL